MTPELAKALKADMGYTDKAPVCRDCKYREEKDDPVLDRSWRQVCGFSNHGTFIISDNGTCSKFEPKP